MTDYLVDDNASDEAHIGKWNQEQGKEGNAAPEHELFPIIFSGFFQPPTLEPKIHKRPKEDVHLLASSSVKLRITTWLDAPHLEFLMRLCWTVGIIGLLAAFSPLVADTAPAPPLARQIDHISVWHGEKVNDPFHWLREKSNLE